MGIEELSAMIAHNERVDCPRELEDDLVKCRSRDERFLILQAYWRELCDRMNNWKGWGK